jgi:hypothetical protein
MAKKKRETSEQFCRRVRQENIRRAMAEGRLEEAEAYIRGYLSRGLLSRGDVTSFQAELARRKGNA